MGVLFCLWLLPQLIVGSLRAEVSGESPHAAIALLEAHCSECHGIETAKQGLRLTAQAEALSGSINGPVIIPGQPEDSLLVQLLLPDAEPHMPPKKQLRPNEIEVIRDWIGSLDAVSIPSVSDARSDEIWSFRPLTRPTIPAVDDPWIRGPIDAFIVAQQRARDLSHGPETDKETLLRRISFDLIGLPPSPAERIAFLNDPKPDAYERLVDRLLASPQYGERWGRHWLDLARYADSSGFHDDLHRPHAWRYRDYIIESLNEDKAYQQFVVEQVAGDLLPAPTESSWVATGFSRNGPSNENNMGNGADREQYRFDQLDDAVSTTASVFLGLTLGCARCHDHKYDPLSQRDYYRFLAYFQNGTKKTLSLASVGERLPEFSMTPKKSPDLDRLPLAAVFTDRGNPVQPTRILWRGSVNNRGPIVTPGVPALLAEQEVEVEDRVALARWMVSPANPLTWRVIVNRVWAFHFGEGLVRTPSNFGTRGIPPTHPSLLDYLASQLIEHRGSLKWLHREIVTSATYRQSSLVSPMSGERDPTNLWWTRMNKRRLESELLRDAMLAVSGNLNVEMGGPGIKPRIRPELLSASQRNKWPMIEADDERHWRRSVYVYVKRQLPFPMLDLFGSPSTAHSCAKRVVSQVPTQALVLLNDSFVFQQAISFARRVQPWMGTQTSDPLEYANQVALGRDMAADRRNEAMGFIANQTRLLQSKGLPRGEAELQALTLYCQVLFNLSEFIYVD